MPEFRLCLVCPRNVSCLLIIFLLGCSWEKEPDLERMIEFDLSGLKLSIPSDFLSYPDDFDGGMQKTITINFNYPSMEPFSKAKVTNASTLRAGRGVRVLIHNKATSAADAWDSIIEYRRKSIIGTEEVGGFVKYKTKEESLLEYFVYQLGAEDMKIISCPKRKSKANIIICKNSHKTLNGNIFLSYLFEKRLLKDIEVLDQRIENLILTFVKEENNE
jgi:hypothetical protein